LAENFDPLEAVPYLTAPWPSYVSLYSALSRHGLIEEIPQVIYAISAGRATRYKTPLGSYQIHHLPKHLIWGFKIEHSGQGAFPLAEPEKAFLDTAYLGLIPRSPLGMPYKRDHRWKLDPEKLTRYAKRFHFPPLLVYLRSEFT
jgi:predicted transcriptional regulator of viral defense system